MAWFYFIVQGAMRVKEVEQSLEQRVCFWIQREVNDSRCSDLKLAVHPNQSSSSSMNKAKVPVRTERPDTDFINSDLIFIIILIIDHQ